ncbi:hypothetical protein BFJ68_g11918 [Fusarium oxysporum]|uniref:Uncharacterized protein n=1 Tax=Fusarium oxysporum TaxID=5507 RepID=A0A420P7S9_FUSOX|nr:hypothetical protein BFJ71_g12949 [Fusarium oxysporum]RKL02365.1 hypothetical protein BFJ68_g11918 [Fusarium oxysporum]
MCLWQLEILGIHQQQTQNAFDTIKNNMKENAEALKRIEKERELSDIKFTLVDEKDRPIEFEKPEESAKNIDKPRSKNSGRHSKKKKRTSQKERRSKRKSLPPDAMRSSVSVGGNEARRDKGGKRTQNESIPEGIDDTYNAEIDAQRKDLDDVFVERTKVSSAEGPEAPSRKYGLIIQDSQIAIIATNTKEYQSASRVDRDETQKLLTYPLEEISENMSEEGVGDMESYFNVSPSSPDFSPSEPDDDVIPFNISIKKRLRASIGQTVDLSKCASKTEKTMVFCVHRIKITETCQTFNLHEPCQHQQCKHMGLELMNEFSTTKTLPCTLTFQFVRSSLPQAETASGQGIDLQSLDRCRRSERCFHSVIEGILPQINDSTSEKVRCVREYDIQVWLNDGWQSDAPEVKPVPHTENNALPSEPAQDDDVGAFELLEGIRDRRRVESPSFHTLVASLKLAEKYSLGSLYLRQCRIWTVALLPNISTSFDQHAIAWVWVLWKLRMGPEFKKLSGIMQQQAKHRIDQDTHEYGVIIPKHIVDAIEQKRVLVLSQIQNSVISLTESSRHEYMDCFKHDSPLWIEEVGIMRSSLMAGYLTLECERCLPTLNEVSFADASGWIRSMMDLSGWMVRTVPPAYKMPTLLALATTVVPVIGAGLHSAGTSGLFSSEVYDSLNNLIEKLEGEDWGLDLVWQDIWVKDKGAE